MTFAGGQRRNFFAQGRLKAGALNKTEAAYEQDLRDEAAQFKQGGE